MPLNLIPNQPFIFESPLYAQDCLNNDNLEYSQMVQPNDTICVQQQMEPCDEAINCEPTMSAGTGVSVLNSWTSLASGWSSATPQDLVFSGTGSGTGYASQVNGGLIPGIPYYVTWNVTAISGGCATEGVFVTLEQNTPYTFYETGVYSTVFICSEAGDYILFGSNSTDVGAEVTITDINYFSVSNCWFGYPQGDSVYPSWRYTLDTDDFVSYAIGKWCSLGVDEGDLVNSSAYTIDGSYHRVNVTVSECTVGYVEVVLGGVYLGQTSGNGDFVFYGTPTDASGELRFVKRDLFDGCLSNCTVDEFGVVDNTDPGNSVYKLYVANDSGVATTDELSFEVFEDRVTWCFNVSELENGGNPIELGCDIIYRLLLTEQCLEEDLTSYVSVTTLRYNPDGWDCTKVFDASCEGYAFGFYFGSTTAPEFKLVQRLRVLQFAPRYPAEGEEYLYSSGVSARQYAQSGKIRTAWFDYCDEATHDVIRLQVLCDIATIDDIQVFCPVKDYEPEWDEHRRNLAQSKVDMQLVSEVAVFKRNC